MIKARWVAHLRHGETHKALLHTTPLRAMQVGALPSERTWKRCAP